MVTRLLLGSSFPVPSSPVTGALFIQCWSMSPLLWVVTTVQKSGRNGERHCSERVLWFVPADAASACLPGLSGLFPRCVCLAVVRPLQCGDVFGFVTGVGLLLQEKSRTLLKTGLKLPNSQWAWCCCVVWYRHPPQELVFSALWICRFGCI